MSTDVATQACQHHWILGEPVDGVVRGTCKFCRSIKEYPARLVEDDFSDQAEDVRAQDRQLVASLAARVDDTF